MAKKETHIPAIIDTPEALEAKIAAMKEAQKLFATYTQEQVDKIFKAAATAAALRLSAPPAQGMLSPHKRTPKSCPRLHLNNSNVSSE